MLRVGSRVLEYHEYVMVIRNAWKMDQLTWLSNRVRECDCAARRRP